MNKPVCYEQIKAYIDDLWIIDTHEHLPAWEKDRQPDSDVLIEFLYHYFNRDLVSAGMPEVDVRRALNRRVPLDERWALLAPYWKVCRLTGYGRSLEIAARDIYGVERIDGTTIGELNDKFLACHKDGHYEHILKQKSRILVSLVDSKPDCDKRFFRSMFRMDEVLFPKTLEDLELAQTRGGMRAHTFLEWLDLCDKLVDGAYAQGVAGFKCAMAYERTLDVREGSYREAEQCFNDFSVNRHMPTWMLSTVQPTKAYQDFMLRHIIRRLAKHRLPVQLHTGYQEGNGNILRNADPSRLCSLLLAFEDVRFVLMHMGYPYHHQMGALGKMFPNVTLDMCWAHTLSPAVARAALSEWLETVPYNKICAFGGDYMFVDGIYSHQKMARDNVALVLADKVEAGLMDVPLAKEIARRLFVQNPYDTFNLNRIGVTLKN